MTYIRQSKINTLVLAKYFQIAQTDRAAMWDGGVVDFFAKKIGRQRILMALNSSAESDYLSVYTDEDGDSVYQITAAGYAVIEEMYLTNQSQIRHFVDTDFEAFLSSDFDENDNDQSTQNAVPASDRFVSIGDNLPGYQEILATVESASETIRASNSLAAEERSWLRVHIDLGLELLRRGGTALRSALRSLIFEPLKAALKETSEENLRAAVRAALEALKTFLGIQ
ncbi:hypothetical protein [Novosphingobium sp. CECT 9465]|uniref:hypothetical protein n=1 Tax=Novosphingobium sp. CECT 9465 TaxID=2829794 RepID=UPI001E6519A1|nr:hypothetical protein [Novosphingobium sp. CECT 9465]CAH0496973.1 hypothetical protein NVSP9465_02023 [Novosphingobium sp. CECT 9465]